MKRITLLAFFLVFSTVLSAQLLFPICGENGKWGYMNEEGEWVIHPRFHKAYDFSEGLAAVREGGYYGYINPTGNWVFEPKFEFARPFKDGRAIVYESEKPSVLLRNGEFLYRNVHQAIEYANSDVLLVVLNPSMDLVLLNSENEIIHSATGGSAYAILPHLFVVSYRSEEGITESRLINDEGEVLYTKQPNDEFYSAGDRMLIARSSDAFIEVDILDEEGHVTGTFNNSILDAYSYVHELHFNDDKAITRIYLEDRTPSENTNNPATILAILEDDGTFTPFPDSIKMATGIVDNRMLVRNSEHDWWLCDEDFDKVGNFVFDGFIIPINQQQFATPPFTGGHTGAMYKDEWYSVNENGRISNRMTFSNFADPHVLNEGVIRFSRNTSDFHLRASKRLYGLWDLTSGNLVPAEYDIISPTPLSNKWYAATQDVKSGFIKTDNTRLGFLYDVPYSPVNVDHHIRMLRFNPPIRPDSASRAMYSMDGHFEYVEAPKKRELYLELWSPPTELKSSGMMVHIVNGMHSSDANLRSLDGELFISIEAKDASGNWRQITHFPTSWCGNSRYPLRIPPKHRATYIFPEFEGQFETELRVALTGILEETDDSDGFNRPATTIYSDTFTGHINPAQLWRSQLAVP
ncbi:MAG: WG repeat-containing protein [Bacteroidetes bacterium]|nr:MAG: WG repeat-containing protein [Bacteroidota bacterium]